MGKVLAFGMFAVSVGISACGNSSSRGRDRASGGFAGSEGAVGGAGDSGQNDGAGTGGAMTGEGGSLVGDGGVGSGGSAAANGGGAGGSSAACTDGLESRVRYLASEVEQSSECALEVQTRSCAGGVWSEWSGAYTEESCARRTPLGCDGHASGTIEYRTRYRAPTTSPGGACEAEVQTRECRDGTWTSWGGTFSTETCEAADHPACGETPHGGRESRLRYQKSEVAYDAQCVVEIQERTCSFGDWTAWSGSYGAESCSIAAARTCEGTAHGATETRVRYAAALVIDAPCVFEVQTRTCLDGSWSSWSGTYAEPACHAEESDPCLPGYDACAVCGGTGPIRYYTDEDRDGFGNSAEPRDICPGADTFGLVRNADDLDPTCFTRKGSVRIQTAPDLEALEGVCELAGDLDIVLEGTAAVAIELAALERIHGRLWAPTCPEACQKNGKLSALKLPALAQVQQIQIGELAAFPPVDLSALARVPKDVSVLRASSLDLRSLTRVDGNLSLGAVGNVDISSLEEVVGAIGVAAATGLRASSLTSAGALKIGGSAQAVEQTAFPKLRVIARSLELLDAPNLDYVSFPALETARDLSIVNAPRLSYRIYFPRLEQLESLTVVGTAILNFECHEYFSSSLRGLRNVSFSHNAELAQFRCLAETDAAGQISFIDNARLAAVEVPHFKSAVSVAVGSDRLRAASFDDLETVTGDLRVSGGYYYLEHVDLPALAHVGGSMSVDAGRIALELPSLESVDGDLTIRDGSGALRLPTLERANGSLIVSSADFTSLEAAELATVGQDLTIRDTLLETIDFHALESVGGRVELVGNSRLPACVADALAAQVGKACTCSGNDGTGTCSFPPTP